jgi:hypothetical protein
MLNLMVTGKLKTASCPGDRSAYSFSTFSGDISLESFLLGLITELFLAVPSSSGFGTQVSLWILEHASEQLPGQLRNSTDILIYPTLRTPIFCLGNLLIRSMHWNLTGSQLCRYQGERFLNDSRKKWGIKGKPGMKSKRALKAGNCVIDGHREFRRNSAELPPD